MLWGLYLFLLSFLALSYFLTLSAVYSLQTCKFAHDSRRRKCGEDLYEKTMRWFSISEFTYIIYDAVTVRNRQAICIIFRHVLSFLRSFRTIIVCCCNYVFLFAQMCNHIQYTYRWIFESTSRFYPEQTHPHHDHHVVETGISVWVFVYVCAC